MQLVVRIFLFLIAIAVLLIGVPFLWGSPKFGITLDTSWLTSYLIGSVLIAYTIPMFWISILGQVKMLSGFSISLFVSSIGSAIFLLGKEEFLFGTLLLFTSLFSIWFFIAGRFAHFKVKLPLPKSVLVLFTIVFSIAFLQGIYLMTANFALFPWILNPKVSTVMGWVFLGSSLYFCWNLFYPFWENANPALFALIVFDALIIGPLFGLFKEPQNVIVVYPFLWGAICVVIISGFWAIWEIIRRFRKPFSS